MIDQPTPTELDSQRPGIRDVWEIAWLPGLFAIVTAATTWLIWYYTNMPCTAELSASIGCNPATVARYIDVDIFGRMLTYSAITAAAGGVWNYNMFTKMRAVIAAETKRADEAEQRLEEYRQQVEEERRQAAEERQRRIETEFQQLAEARRQADAERRQEHQAFMAALTELTAELAHLRQQRNGDGHNGQ